jgi:hypothetical protein
MRAWAAFRSGTCQPTTLAELLPAIENARKTYDNLLAQHPLRRRTPRPVITAGHSPAAGAATSAPSTGQAGLCVCFRRIPLCAVPVPGQQDGRCQLAVFIGSGEGNA